ncbi:VOC family protein [Glutamicibacter nicotianae]|uniref:VOC family protein n=1 Tax=Glutamicibacter nicotianae TaxID=37929 RepID=UPI00167FCA4F|nr:VOC family protein [Glutamicibacter nicotianae]
MSAHELDHVAFAVPSWQSAGHSVHRTLGARWVSGFHQGSFSPCQLELAEGMRLELLQPPAGGGGFIAEHLARSAGAANPHHITFKVADIHAAKDLARSAGVRTILENLENQWWKELFLHPKDTGLGFLVQLVQTELALDGNDEVTAPGAVDCPWDEQPAEQNPAQRLDFIAGSIHDAVQARLVLGTVLGAQITDLEDDPKTQLFSWPLGSSLVLRVNESIPPGLHALSFTDPSTPVPILDAGLLQALHRSGSRFEALGLDILTGQRAHAA